jgi:hypothetical protein
LRGILAVLDTLQCISKLLYAVLSEWIHAGPREHKMRHSRQPMCGEVDNRNESNHEAMNAFNFFEK